MAAEDSDDELGWQLLTGLSLHDFEHTSPEVQAEEHSPSIERTILPPVERAKPAQNPPKTTRPDMEQPSRRRIPTQISKSPADVSIDAEDVLEELEEKQWQALAAEGFSAEEIQAARNRKQWKEDVYLYSYMSSDESCLERETAFLKLAVALEGLNRRQDAIDRLREALEEFEGEPRLTLALAKLLFRNDEKQAAQDLCRSIYDGNTCSRRDELETVLADAFYISGWTAIHMDNHTMAYKIWSQGYQQLPRDPRLARQQRKRSVWDVAWEGDRRALDPIIGQGATFEGTMCLDDMFTSYGVDDTHRSEPCLSLFDTDAQAGKVVFKSCKKVLTKEECANICKIANEHASAKGGWDTVRQSTVPTTDVAVEDIPLLRGWLQELMDSRLKPMLVRCFPKLVDNSTIGARGERVRIHDAFIVRYDSIRDNSLSLPEHCDTSVFSFTVALNDDFEGGGTWFEALGKEGGVVTAETGQAVAFAGPLRHAGYPITAGTRLILVLFLYVEDFNYGPYLQHACNATSAKAASPCQSKDAIRSSGSAPGSYVVYRETVELMNSLEIRVGADA